MIHFGKPKESSPMNEEGKWNSSFCFFSTPNFDLNVLFGVFRDLSYITGGKLYVRTLFSNILHVSKLL